MNKDSKNIFNNYYKLVVEQASEADRNERIGAEQQIGQRSAIQMQQNSTVAALIDAINTMKGIEDIDRQALLKYVSQPQFEQGFVQTLQKMQSKGPYPSEADLNDRANPQSGQAWSKQDVENLEKWKRETPYQKFDMWGNPAKNSSPDQTYDQYGNPSINPEALEREIRADRKNKSGDIDVTDEFLNGPKD